MVYVIGIVAALIILFGFLCYKKAPPTEAIVVTGFGLSKPKVVCGKGTFVLPVLQRADRLNMRLLKIDVKTPETGVKTKNGVSLWIDSVVTIQVYSENSTVLDEEVKASGLKDAKAYIMSRQQAAISNFLGMNEQGINEKVNDVLQGNLREIVSDMTVDQILTNRKQMAVSVIENARPDLAKMGLEVVTFNVQDIRDAVDVQGHNHGVIEAIGIEQEELVKKQAEIARAQAARDVACAKADAEMAANAKEVEAQKMNTPGFERVLAAQIFPCFTIGCWNQTKTVYDFDYEFQKILMDTDDMAIHQDILQRLPIRDFFIPVYDSYDYNGMFVHVEFEEKEKTAAFGIVLVGPAKGSHDDFTFLTLPAWAKENQSLTEATRSTKEYLEKAAGQRQVNGISVPAVMEAVPSVFDGGTPYVRLAILCAYYLASKNPDVRLETSKKRDRPVFVFQGKAQRINIKPYTVGENAAKEYKKNGEGKTPRWRHYWCGNGRERRECKFIY